MDMLVVGMYGKGNVGLSGCNDVQYRTHYSIWALFGSPLMIGCDIRNMNEETKKILENKELIAINQDPEALIFKYCDIGLVDDCCQIIEKLIEIYEENTP